MKKTYLFIFAAVTTFTISCNNAATDKKETATGTDTAVAKESTPAAAPVPEGMALMVNSDCMTCHNATAKVVGPSYADIAAKYPNTPENVAMLAETVRNGGSGKWGAVPMPAHPGLSKDDAGKMAGYILSMNEKK